MMSRIHRNIKLDNFRVKDDKVYIIGLGSILKYQNATGFLLTEKSSSFVGSMPFASISVHNCDTCSMRDDLESMGYCLLALLCQYKGYWFEN
jgi:serine/threonine protein kinase